jgi:hypothetical protein
LGSERIVTIPPQIFFRELEPEPLEQGETAFRAFKRGKLLEV